MEKHLLKVKELHTYFNTDRGVVKAVNGVDFHIKHNETLGIVGESGCGKSVTALSIMRLIPDPPGKIANGKIIFDNQDLLKLEKHKMRDIRGNQISMIFQEPMTSLNPVYRIGTQIAESIRLHNKTSRREALDQAIELLEKVGIPDPLKRVKEYPHQMSGGMRQRVMIAMALACNPMLIIADEPTTALDVTIQAQIMELMDNLKNDFGSSILLITHDLGIVAEMAQWVAVMYAGQIVEYTDVVELFLNPGHPYTIGLMASIPEITTFVPSNKKLKTIPGTVPSLLNLPAICSFENRCSKPKERCRIEPPQLREIKPGHWVRCWNYE